MKHYIDSYDIKKYHKILVESSDDIYSEKCENLYRLAENKKNLDTDLAFFNECAKTPQNANMWLESCLEILRDRYDSRLENVLENQILPITSIRYMEVNTGNSDSINQSISKAYNLSLAKEQVYNFHEAVLKFDPLIESIAEKSDMHNIINRCCFNIDQVMGPDYPVYNKIIASVNESLYNLQLSGMNTESKELKTIQETIDYYSSNQFVSAEDIQLAIKGLKKDPMLSQYYEEGFNIKDLDKDIQFSTNSNINRVCGRFTNQNRPIDIMDMITITDTVMKATDFDIMTNFGCYLLLIERLLISNSTVSEFVSVEVIPNLYKNIYDNIITTRKKARTIVIALIQIFDQAIDRVNNMLNTPGSTEMVHNIDLAVIYKNGIENVRDLLKDSLDFMYTDYANECATMSTLKENVEQITLEDFKLFKFDNLITRCYKVDKFLQNSFNDFKNKFKNSIKNVNQKIFEEYSAYDMLTEDGNVDVCIKCIDISGIDDLSQYHEYCTNLLKSINDQLDEGVVYYTLAGNDLEFRLREDLNLQLSEEDIKLIENTISDEDARRADLISLCAESYRYDYNYYKESFNFFKNPDHAVPGIINTYLECCSYAGVPVETIQELYRDLQDEYSGNNAHDFVIKNSYYFNNYQVQPCDVQISMEAARMIEYILEADKPMTDRQKAAKERMNAKIAQWEKEEEEEENKKKNPQQNNQQEVKKPVNNQPQQQQQNQKKDATDKGGSDKMVKIANNIKLYLHALRGFFKKADAKTQTAIKNMDMTVNRLVKSIKQALVSDRREAIIKGSVIPSFHKCVLIAITFAGVAYFNMPLAIIGAIAGFAASKKLTKKERALLYDDIMIEMRILDKEIARAEDKNQIKKLRQLLRMKKEMERQAARIQYNIRIGKDVVPGGRYINQDND